MHKNNSVHQSTIYNSDNGEDFDYQNQEFPAESPRRTEYYNDAFFNRNRETKPYKKKTYQTPRCLQRTPTQPQSNNINWRIAKKRGAHPY